MFCSRKNIPSRYCGNTIKICDENAWPGNSGFTMDVTDVEEEQEKMRSCLIDDPLQLPCLPVSLSVHVAWPISRLFMSLS